MTGDSQTIISFHHPLHYYSPNLLLLLTLTTTTGATKTCRSYCGNLTVDYPFTTVPGCGHPSFRNLPFCVNDVLMLHLPSGSYRLLNLDYSFHSLTLHDPFFSTCSSLYLRHHTTTPTTTATVTPTTTTPNGLVIPPSLPLPHPLLLHHLPPPPGLPSLPTLPRLPLQTSPLPQRLRHGLRRLSGLSSVAELRCELSRWLRCWWWWEVLWGGV